MTPDDQPSLDLDIEIPEPAPQLSQGARLTQRLQGLAAAGRNPLTGEPGHPTLTCGSCVHRVYRGNVAGRYPKCVHPDTPISGGPATDVRGYWPACPRHQPETS